MRDMRFETTFSQLLCQVLQKTLAVLLQGSICTPLDILMCAGAGCHQVKASHLAEQCSCAGAFKCTDNATDFLERMRVFLNIAIYHGFNLLQEVVSWVLELSLPNCS